MSLSTANARRACRMCDLTNIRVHTYSRCLQGSVANEGVMGNTLGQIGSQGEVAPSEMWSWD